MHTMRRQPFFGNIQTRTSSNLTEMKHLHLVHPWVHPLFHQEFSRDANELDKMIPALRLLTRFRQPFGGVVVRDGGAYGGFSGRSRESGHSSSSERRALV